jgi:hypothetical protein
MGKGKDRIQHAIARAFEKTRKHRASIDRIAGSILLAMVLFSGLWLWGKRSNPQTINYAADLVPGLLAILLAFAPDLRKTYMVWRLAILAIGFGWSLLLWRKEALTAASQSDALMMAVNQANEHSDKHSEQQTKELMTHSDERLDGRINGVLNAFSETAKKFDNKVDELRPTRVDLARLTFGFWSDDNSRVPLIIQQSSATSDGSFRVEFACKNASPVAAKNGEIWVNICTACRYAREPSGFSKLEGMDEHVRYKQFQSLNAGVPLEKMSISVFVPTGSGAFDTSFAYACENCAKVAGWDQTIRSLILPPSPLMLPSILGDK